MVAMISVVIATQNDAQTLGQTLASLVPAAVDGLVREVILADAGSTDDTLAIAEDAGARVTPCTGSLEARLLQRCMAARSDWLLILEALPPPAPTRLAERRGPSHRGATPSKPACWGRGGLAPFVTPAKALHDSAPRLFETESASPGWRLRRVGSKATGLKIKRWSD